MVYALLDKETLLKKGVSLKKFIKKIDTLNISILQYRNKVGTINEKREDLILIKRYFNGRVIVNDTIELIDESDGLHIGQEDIRAYSNSLLQSIEIIREKIGRKILGLSTHNYKEIIEANSLDLDYIGLGAYRATSTKSKAKILGKEALELAKYSKHPVALIGGVRLSDKFDKSIYYRVVGSNLYDN